jgi:hypothetical protein
MDAIVVLTATSNAPAGATGVAKIESENDEGNETASMEVKTSGLTPGDYLLSITLQSNGTNIDLAAFTVNANDDEDNDDQGEDNLRLDLGEHWVGCDWGGFTNWGSWTNCTGTNWTSFCHHGDDDQGENEGEQTEVEVDLPAGVNPTDIAQITVTDSGGNPVLVGDLVNPASTTVINVSATVSLTPGAATPSVSGTAQLRSTASKGHWKHQFSLAASGMNAKSTFKLNVNGKTSGAAKSDKTGNMKIKRLPSRTPALRSLRLLDTQGNVAASARF